MSAHQGGWTTEGNDGTDAAVIVAYLTRIVCRDQVGRDEEIAQLMAGTITDSLCAVLELDSVAVAAAARAYIASKTRLHALQGEV